ncbi:glycosyltransferase family 2 protein [Algoriphagus sanaruensis]|uniref:Glycosyl transferase family 2 n=1 Tax=Algoriphagus sanaruensis TaxID=1727163 RepID=A0A142ELP8_9BACT|nr:glycosyltransferase family 2 protein [Algoriphagus sanaruensis]AMQ56053.1 glycosyl transferase family 2 [Algoriphagus sanaruensis]
MSQAAIVILNYNGEEVLNRFLPSVIEHSQYDCWVIDNCSSDHSIELLRDKFPQISVIELQANLGYAGGYNWGLEALKSNYEYFILLNSDVEVSPGWDSKLVDFLSLNKDYSAVQPKILSAKNKEEFDYAGAGGGFLDALGYPYCRGRILETIEREEGQYDDVIQIDWASGACLAIRSTDFFEQDGFDAHFFAHMEEIDLCWRLRLAGKKIGYIGTSTVFHLGGATLSRSSAKKLYLNIRNSLSMLHKNLPSSQFFGVVLLKMIWETLALFSYLLKGQFEFSSAIAKGYWDFTRNWNKLTKTQKIKNRPIGRSGKVFSILWSYLILRRKKYSQL